MTIDDRDPPLAGVLDIPQSTPEPAPEMERRLVVALGDLAECVLRVLELGGRFVTLFVASRPERSLVAVLALRGELVALRAPLDGSDGGYSALAELTPAAAWPERELVEREALRPHPLPETLLRPDVDIVVRRATGPETFVIPYGPIRSGVFEAIQFVIETGGEDVLALETRPGFKHRALEDRFAGLPVAHGGVLAERVAGIAAVAHAIAFAEAVERALDVEAPRRAELWRSVHAELERVANHLDVAAKLAEDAALSVGQARMQILKEQVLRLRADLCGSRFGRGIVIPGGVREEGRVPLDELTARLERFDRELARDRTLLLRTTSFTDRLIGSGHLDRTTIETFAGVGPVARACDVATDARYERPYAGYRWLGFRVVTDVQGDAMGRLAVRFGEIRQSLHLVRQAIDRLERSDGELRVQLPGADGAAFGWAEAPQGELVYWVEVGSGVVERCRVASPSARNWPLFRESFRGDVLTDFGFIEHSFGLTPAGADR